MRASATEARLRSFLDEISLENLRPAILGLAAIHAIAAVAIQLALAPRTGQALAAAAGGSVIVLLVLYRALGNAAPRYAHPAAAAVTLLALGNACLCIGLSHDARFVPTGSLLLVGCSIFFLSWPWLSLTATIGAAGLLGTTWWALPPPATWVAIPPLLLAFALAGILHDTRLRANVGRAKLRLAQERVRTQLEQSVALLRQSEDRLRHLAESSSEAILIHESGRILDANSVASQILGRNRADLLGRTLSAFLSRDPSAKQTELHPVGQPFEATVERPDGTRLPVEVSGRAIPYHGHLTSVTTLRDVTERKRAEEALAARRSLERLVTTISADFVKLAPGQLEEGIRKAIEDIGRLFGADHAVLVLLDAQRVPSQVCEWIAEDMAEPVAASRSARLEDMPWLFRRIAALEAAHVADVGDMPPQAVTDKSFLQACGVKSLIALPIADGDRIVGCLSLAALRKTRPWSDEAVALLRIVTEITAGALKRQSALAELEASETRKAAILEAALDCIITTDERGHVVEFNPAAQKTFGYELAYTVGRSLRDLIVPERLRSEHDDGLHTLFASAERAVLGQHTEVTCCRADGTEFPAEIAVVSIQLGPESGFTVYLRDITQRREVERLRDELVAAVSHELRTPLTSLRGFAELMLEKEFPLARQRKYLTVIHNEAVRLTQLVNDFLDMKRIESGSAKRHLDSIDLAAMLREVEALFRREDGSHEIQLEIDPELRILWGDAGQLRQVFTNLASNAVKFSPDGGRIVLGARNDDEGILVWVSDEGIGISQEDMRRLFEKFYRVDNAATRSIGGTGLGLALTKEIVLAHGGRIWVESDLGKGSTFYIALPTIHKPDEPDDPDEVELSYAAPISV
jgi:PAS domain S-box-containing protein